MPENQQIPAARQAAALGRAGIGVAGVIAAVAGFIGAFANIRLLAGDLAGTPGFSSMLAPMTAYHFAWLVFFGALVAAGISLMAAAVQGRREDIVPGPSLYLMGAALLIAGMAQLLFGRAALAGLTGLAGLLLIFLEYRSALL